MLKVRRQGFAFELSAHGQVGRAAEEIRLRLLVDIAFERRHAEHFARPFAVAGGDDRGVDVHEVALLKKLMNCERQPAARAKHGAEQVRAPAADARWCAGIPACDPSSAAGNRRPPPINRMREARSSHFWPGAGDGTRLPSTTTEAPVVK